jgi:hypothetical protein
MQGAEYFFSVLRKVNGSRARLATRKKALHWLQNEKNALETLDTLKVSVVSLRR